MQLISIEQPANEIISLEETKNYLRIDHDFDDSLINMLIKSTRQAMESIIQKSIMKQKWQYIIDSRSACNLEAGESNYPSIFCNQIIIPLPKPPVVDVISVTIGEVEIPKQKYSLEQINGKFCVCFDRSKFISSRKNIQIKIVYEAGIANDPNEASSQLKLANLMLVANAYNERYAYKQNSVVSQGVKQLLRPFLNLRLI
jgi:hypothetical protein